MIKSLRSRKFVLAVLGGFVAFANGYWDMGLTVNELWMVVTPLLAYIGVEGIADYKERKLGK